MGALAVLVAASLAILPTAASAQVAPTEQTHPLQPSNQELQEQGLPSGPMGTPLETPVDPATYRLLPGDLLNLGLWGEAAKGYALAVSPQGELMIPKVGPIPVAGKTIAEAEKELTGLLGALYPRSRVSLRLIAPGKFRLSVSGMVNHPGVFEITRVDRLSTALETAGGISGGGSVRSVRILDGEGNLTREVDLLPWLVDGDPKFNPLIEPGTSIDVMQRGPSVYLRGPVNGRSGIDPGEVPVHNPGAPEEEPSRIFEWRPGDTVGTMLEMAGGLSERADGTGLLIRNGATVRKLDLRADSSLAVPVVQEDLVEVIGANRWVFVVGAVRIPGRYPYLPGMSAWDYVAMAGGATELGRNSDWTLQNQGERRTSAKRTSAVYPGSTIRVPERRTYTVTTLLTPLTSAVALVLSLVALRHGI